MVKILTPQDITSDDAPLFENHSVTRKELRDPGKKFVKVETTHPASDKMISFGCDVIYMTFRGDGHLLFSSHPAVEPQQMEVHPQQIILVSANTLHRFESSKTTTIVATMTELLPEGQKMKETMHIVLPQASTPPKPTSTTPLVP